jgi:hypothetical protein
VRVAIWARLCDDGIDPLECNDDYEFDEASEAGCASCGYHGKLGDFFLNEEPDSAR